MYIYKNIKLYINFGHSSLLADFNFLDIKMAHIYIWILIEQKLQLVECDSILGQAATISK